MTHIRSQVTINDTQCSFQSGGGAADTFILSQIQEKNTLQSTKLSKLCIWKNIYSCAKSNSRIDNR